MKRIRFDIDEKDCDVIGVIADKKDNWERLIPIHLHSQLKSLYDGSNGDFNQHCQGFTVGEWPVYVIVIFTCADIISTLQHEVGHVYRHITWDIGDSIAREGDEGYGKLQTKIFDTFMDKLKKEHGLKVTCEFKPDARQKKREIK